MAIFGRQGGYLLSYQVDAIDVARGTGRFHWPFHQVNSRPVLVDLRLNGNLGPRPQGGHTAHCIQSGMSALAVAF